MLLLMPRLVGRAKRLPMPAALRGLDLAPRHLALLAYLQYDGPLTVNQLAERLEVAPTTVSLMVGDLSRHGVLTRTEDDADRRRRIVAIAPDYAAPITRVALRQRRRLDRSARRAHPGQRATVVSRDARLRGGPGETRQPVIRERADRRLSSRRVHLENARQALGETSSFAPSGALESRTATSPGRLRATSTQLPLWPL